MALEVIIMDGVNTIAIPRDVHVLILHRYERRPQPPVSEPGVALETVSHKPISSDEVSDDVAPTGHINPAVGLATESSSLESVPVIHPYELNVLVFIHGKVRPEPVQPKRRVLLRATNIGAGVRPRVVTGLPHGR